ncbi:protein ABHD13-like [Diadema setosum]|uniref:protein ABHD13-like n=1 Tax=Diadema setosum TaxID=31175 RepID=UPI003B3B3F7D
MIRMTDEAGFQEAEINGSEDTTRLLDSAPEVSKPPPSVSVFQRPTMSKLAAVVQVFLLLSLHVVFKFWKVCIAELLLIILVFWLYGGVIAFFLMMAGFLTVIYNMQDFLLYFPDNPKMSTVFVPSAAILDLPYENLSIKTSDWVKLSAVLLKQPPERASRSPTILFLHGNAGNLGHRLFNAKLLYTMCQCNVLLLDYRGYGRSEGVPSESGLYIDAQSTLDYLHTRRDIDPSQIFIFGRSLGGAVAIDVASEKRNIGRLKGLLVENTFTCIQEMGSHLFSSAVRWIPLCLVKNKFLSYKKVSSIHTATLFLSGTADELVPPKMMKDLFMRCKGPKKSMYCFTGGTHNETWHCDHYFTIIRDFIWKIPHVHHPVTSVVSPHPHSHHSHTGAAGQPNASIVFNA